MNVPKLKNEQIQYSCLYIFYNKMSRFIAFRVFADTIL